MTNADSKAAIAGLYREAEAIKFILPKGFNVALGHSPEENHFTITLQNPEGAVIAQIWVGNMEVTGIVMSIKKTERESVIFTLPDGAGSTFVDIIFSEVFPKDSDE